MIRIGTLALLIGALPLLPVGSTLAHADGFVDALPDRLPIDRCPQPAQLTLDKAAAAVRAIYLPAQPSTTEVIAGVTLRDDPRVLGVLRRTLGDRPPAGWAQAAAGCHDGVCALRAALAGEPQAWEGALWLLVIGSTGVVASVDQAPWTAPSVWHVSELRELAYTLRDLHDELLHAPHLRAFRRVPVGQTVPAAMADGHRGTLLAASVSADVRAGGGVIYVRSELFGGAPEHVRAGIAHEIGHEIEFSQAADEHGTMRYSHGDEWLAIGGWTPPLIRSLPVGYQRQRATDGSEEPWTDQAWPSEELPEALAHFRYAGEVLHAYSPAAYAFAARFFDHEHRHPAPAPALDAYIERAGGILALFRRCDAQVELAWQEPHGGPAELTRTCRMPSGSTAPLSISRWGFVSWMSCQSCVDRALERLRKVPGFATFACADDELDVAVAERLEEVEGAFLEVSERILRARPPGTFERCLHDRDLRGACTAGPDGMALARAGAESLLARFSPATSLAALPTGALDQLADEILAQTPLGLDPVATGRAWPQLSDGKEALAACLMHVERIAPRGATDPTWRFWMRDEDSVRGFPEPLMGPCPRFYAASLTARGFRIDAANQRYFGRPALMAAAPLSVELRKRLLGDGGDLQPLRTRCALTAGKAPSPTERACLTGFVAAQLRGLVPDRVNGVLATKLASGLWP